MRNVFIVRMSNEGFAEYALDRSKVVIGWSAVPDLNLATNRDDIKNALRESEWYENERAIGNVAGSIDRFIFSIKPDDYVVFPVYKGFYLGKVVSGGDNKAAFNEEEIPNDRAWQWDVVWEKNDDDGDPKKFNRTILPASLHYSLKTQHTCIQLAVGSDSEIEKAIKRVSGIDINQKILEENSEYLSAIGKEINESLNENTFEVFVKKMLEKEGADTVEILSKNDKRPGDIDIIAVFSVNCMGNGKNDEFTYGYQCKHYVGETDSYPVKQLIDRVKSRDNDVDFRKLFAVTAGSFNQEAIQMAREYNGNVFTENSEPENELPPIELIDGNDLSRWLVELGLKGLEVYTRETI